MQHNGDSGKDERGRGECLCLCVDSKNHLARESVIVEFPVVNDTVCKSPVLRTVTDGERYGLRDGGVGRLGVMKVVDGRGEKCRGDKLERRVQGDGDRRVWVKPEETQLDGWLLKRPRGAMVWTGWHVGIRVGEEDEESEHCSKVFKLLEEELREDSSGDGVTGEGVGVEDDDEDEDEMMCVGNDEQTTARVYAEEKKQANHRGQKEQNKGRGSKKLKEIEEESEERKAVDNASMCDVTCK
ncbi:hypothetical protein BC835DRAFT_1310999 [Cytidiella melzeri]|nr:hypothetical protein BC835DRAFT_1310999 [Cytidiella melzeri]